MRRTFTNLFACACLVCMNPHVSMAGVDEITSMEVVMDETHPAPTNFRLESYKYDSNSSGWAGWFAWDLPSTTLEGVSLKSCRITALVGDSQEEKDVTSTYDGITSMSPLLAYKKFGASKYVFKIYAKYSDGTESAAAEYPIDLSDVSLARRGHVFLNGTKLVDAGLNTDSGDTAPDVVKSTFLINGIIGNEVYAYDTYNGIKLLLTEEMSSDLKVGDKVTDVTGILTLPEGSGTKCFTLNCSSFKPVSHDNETVSSKLTIDDMLYNSTNNLSYSNYGKLYTLKGLTLTLDKEHKTAKISQESDEGTKEIGLNDSSEAIYGPDFSVAGLVDMSGFVDFKTDGTPVFVLRSIDDIAVSKTSYADLQEFLSLDEPDVLPIKSEILVTGIVDYNMGMGSGKMYFMQDGSSAISLLSQEGGVMNLGESTDLSDISVGDIITNLELVYDWGSYSFSKATILSNENAVTPAAVTVGGMVEDPSSYVNRPVRIDNATYTVDAEMDQWVLTQGVSSVSLYYFQMLPPAVQTKLSDLENKVISGVYFVINSPMGDDVLLYPRSADDLQESTPDNISNTKTSQITIESGMITVEGASVEVYNASGCKVAASHDGKVSVAGVNGMMIIKAVYANGEVKVVKAMAK